VKQLALVTVLQFAENLTDRQAAQMVARAIDWKYSLSLELIDPGFDYTVLSGVSHPSGRPRPAGHGLRDAPGSSRRPGACDGWRLWQTYGKPMRNLWCCLPF
jgi:Transposase domain (DUF772)